MVRFYWRCLTHVVLCAMAHVFVLAACCAPCQMLRCAKACCATYGILVATSHIAPMLYVWYVEAQLPSVALSVVCCVGCHALRRASPVVLRITDCIAGWICGAYRMCRCISRVALRVLCCFACRLLRCASHVTVCRMLRVACCTSHLACCVSHRVCGIAPQIPFFVFFF